MLKPFTSAGKVMKVNLFFFPDFQIKHLVGLKKNDLVAQYCGRNDKIGVSNVLHVWLTLEESVSVMLLNESNVF